MCCGTLARSHARRSGLFGPRWEETVGRAAQGSPGGTRKLRGLGIPAWSPPSPRHQWKFRQNHPGNPQSRHAMTWGRSRANDPFGRRMRNSVINRNRRAIKFVKGTWERVLDSRLWPKSFTGKRLEVLSSKGLVWRSPLKTNRRKLERTKQN